MIVDLLVYAVSIGFLILFVIGFRKTDMTLKKMIVISLFSAIAFILSFIQFISYPQGGGINLVPMVPIMLIGILYGNAEGMTCGLIFGILSLITGGHIVSIAEALLDYILAFVVLGLSGFVGRDNKYKILISSIIVVALSVFSNIVSGVYFYGEYAPQGMNVWKYSIVYNLTSTGVVGILSIIVIMLLPLNKLKKAIKA
ncbi:energy-coupled thiamine transporter ThiT [Clostridium mediterraneense]|uniref:energy-coupled thiamine transporter ThiT n=1 Tax=Clostridium mediterraneense TaxID=1805472 RepID=UPI0008361078|nr:energy-coupled thiamine transporter ThiT [Clostridium mediterraneense]